MFKWIGMCNIREDKLKLYSGQVIDAESRLYAEFIVCENLKTKLRILNQGNSSSAEPSN